VATGGSVQLVKLIDKHGSAVLADLARYYHRDLRDLWRPDSDLTPRYVLWLVEHLPDDSATKADMRGGPQMRAWTQDVHLLGMIANLLYAANRQRGGKPTRSLPVKPPKPTRGRRPGARIANVAAIAARYRQDNAGR
jgi:hypothetical protein